MAEFGFVSPRRIANWVGPQPRLERPLGVVAGVARRGFPAVELEIANLGCATCHAAPLYGEDGRPTGDAWLGLPNASIDLSGYAGGEVLIRFEVITDFSINRDGFQLDDIEIPELGFFDGAEDDSAGWEAVGFVRSTNFVPVNWIVWLIELTLPTRVTRIEVDDLSQVQFLIEGFGDDFPFAAVVSCSADEMARMPLPMGKTLVVTALTEDRKLVDRLIGSPLVDRLNVGPIATNVISWDQPHEGNLFEHLYARRSFQAAVAI